MFFVSLVNQQVCVNDRCLISIAAALSYGLGVAGTKNIVICDFGGGTFDVSVMNITEGQFKVFQSAIKEMNRY